MRGDDLGVVLEDVVSVLNRGQFGFHLTGGLASSFYGEPRFTQDIDIVLTIPTDSSREFLFKELSEKFIVEWDALCEAVRRERIFQALHKSKLIKVDFHVGEAIPNELSRSKQVELLPNIFVPLVSMEDSILSKLIWISKGSEKARLDVKAMLQRSGEIDILFLEAQARALNLDLILKDLWSELEN